MIKEWDLILHFDSKNKLFIKRDYVHEDDFFGRIYVKTPGKSEELLKLLQDWHSKNRGFFRGGMFKLNNYGEVLRHKKLIGKVDVFPSFLDFIYNTSKYLTCCTYCGSDFTFSVCDYKENSYFISMCQSDVCKKYMRSTIEMFPVKFIEHGHLAGMPDFKYDFPVDNRKLFKCLIQEYELYWKRVQD